MNYLIRPLGLWEQLCQYAHDYSYGNGIISTVSLFHCKNLDVNHLLSCIDKLQLNQPMLRARILLQEDLYFFQIDKLPQHLPGHVLAKKEEFDWQQHMLTLMHQPFAKEGYQWRFLLLEDKITANHALLVAANHSISDGLSLVAFFTQLFNLYQQYPVKNYSLLPAAEALLSHHEDKKCLPPADFCNSAIVYAEPIPLQQRSTDCLFINLPTEQTKQVLQFCQQQQISVNDFLNALMLTTMHELFGERSISLHTPINLRSLANPPVPEDYLGCYISVITTYHKTIAKNVVQLAKEYQLARQQLMPGEAVFRPQLIRPSLMSSLAKWQEAQKQFALGPAVSNLGAIHYSWQNELHWTKFYFTNSRISGDTPFLLSTATLNEQLFCTLSSTRPLLKKETLILFKDTFIQLLSHCIIQLCADNFL